MKTLKKILGALTLCLLILSLPLSSSFAAGEDDLISKPIIKWGGDSEGNVPFMFPDPNNDQNVIGFEIDILDAMADYLGVELQFVHNAWDALIPGLERDLYDIALSGLEITPEHEEVVNFSIPYYNTYLQMVVPRGTKNIHSVQDCVDKRVGTLKQSYSYFTLVEAGVKDIRTYDNEINAYQDMSYGRLDAVLMDSPIAIYYAGFDSTLEFVGDPIGEIKYGIAIKKGNDQLLAQINQALIHLRNTGKLREIYDRWNMWTPTMAVEFNDYSPPKFTPDKFEYWASINRSGITLKDRFNRYAGILPALIRGAVITMEVSLSAMLIAVALGLLLALARLFAPKPLSSIAILYIELFRGTPVLIQLFFIFYGLPALGIKFSPFMAGVIGLGLNYAAYEAENYRAGLLSVPRQQFEGALALGLTRTQALRHVIIPQAVRISLPPITNDFISLLKDSSLVSIITLIDLTKVYGQLANTYYDYFGIGIIVAIIYLLLGLPFVRLARYVENKLAVAITGEKANEEDKEIRAATFHN